MPPPKRAPFSCFSLLTYFFIAAIAFWVGLTVAYLYLKAQSGGGAAPAASAAGSAAPQALRAALKAPSAAAGGASAAAAALSAPASALAAALARAAAALAVLPWERLPLVHYTLRLTGHPPLVSRGDLTRDGNPDMENFGLAPALPAPAFFMVDPWEGDAAAAAAAAPLSDNPLRYIVQSEDSIRDIVVSMLASPGKVRASHPGQRTCRASPVTVPFGCMASLRHQRPELFGKGGQPLPASEGGPLVVDVGFTSAGYYALLAASLGVSSLAVDTQPQCALWARVAAQASGVQGRMSVHAAMPWEAAAAAAAAAAASGSKGGGGVPTLTAAVRTGCIGTSTTEDHASQARVGAFYGTEAARRTDPADDGGRAVAEAARKFRHTEQDAEGLGDVGGGGDVALPVAALDDILCATYPALCADAPAAAAARAPTLLLLKIDSRGWEAQALLSLQYTLTSPNAPLNIVLELNKQHTALALRLPSALEAARGAGITVPSAPSAEELVRGLGLPAFQLTEADNQAVADEYVGIVQQFLELGYEVLVADRGWWAAQDPWREVNLDKYKPLAEGLSLEDWAKKFNSRGEVDICALPLPCNSAAPGPGSTRTLTLHAHDTLALLLSCRGLQAGGERQR